ncbi:MAG TPA: hypothetical protein VG937_38635 [Polyangiaceae bacterium]|nr:hypothetical protein [Polyangiaceae bacterium]
MARRDTPRPGLAKAHSEPLLSRRALPLVKSSDYRLRELFEHADVMSEGKTRVEPDGATYYGSTSVLLTFVSRGGAVPDDGADEIVSLMSIDPHARVRAIRIACLEAQVRARAPIGRVRAEVAVRRDRRGVRMDVEVEARVFEDATQPKPVARVSGTPPPPRSARK